MKLIIDIPEEVKQKIDENLNACDLDIYDCVMLATQNGMPLEEKSSHWIKEGLLFTCANCGHKYMSVGRENGDNYCSHCGAKMGE